MKGTQDAVNQAKSLVQRLREKEVAADLTLAGVNTIIKQISDIGHFREENVVNVITGKSAESEGNNVSNNDDNAASPSGKHSFFFEYIL